MMKYDESYVHFIFVKQSVTEYVLAVGCFGFPDFVFSEILLHPSTESLKSYGKRGWSVGALRVAG